MRSLLTLIVILCSLTDEKLLSQEFQSKVMLNCGITILAKLQHNRYRFNKGIRFCVQTLTLIFLIGKKDSHKKPSY